MFALIFIRLRDVDGNDPIFMPCVHLGVGLIFEKTKT